MPSYRADGDELPSLEATLTKRTSLYDHLEWQLKLSTCRPSSDEIVAC